MGCCVSCLRGRNKSTNDETEPLLYEDSESRSVDTQENLDGGKSRDLSAIVQFVGDNLVDISTVGQTDLDSSDHGIDAPELHNNWRWPVLSPLGEEENHYLDTVYSTLSKQGSVEVSDLSLEF